MIKRIFCIALLAVLSVGVVSAQKSPKVKKSFITIGAPHKAVEQGSLLDLKNGKTYNITDIQNTEEIDMVYAWGTNSKANLMGPTSTGINLWPVYKNGLESWETKNRTMLVAIKADKANKKIFKKLKTSADVEKLYTETAKSVKSHEDYKLTKYGPARRLEDLQEGDLVLVRSQDRKFYAAGMVVIIKTGVRGSIDIDFKIAQ